MAVFSDIMGLLKSSGNLYAETNKDTTVIKLLKNVINRTEKVIESCDKFLKNHGVNIADLSKSLVGHYVDYKTGLTADQIDHTLLGPYEISASTEYKFPQTFKQQLAFYNSDMNYISGLEKPPANKIIETPLTAKYIKITVPNDQISHDA